jgi:phage N-6-adenine-methyltransferase
MKRIRHRALFNPRGYPLNRKTSSGDNYSTPWTLFRLLDAEFHFAIDAAADVRNHKCAKYWTVSHNALLQAWRGVVFCNPPYSDIAAWVKKMRESADAGAVVVGVLPARTSEPWFRDYCQDCEIRILEGRIMFNGAPGKAVYHATFATMICIFRKESARIKMPDGSTRLNVRSVAYPLSDPGVRPTRPKTKRKKTQTRRGQAIAADLAGKNERLNSENRRLEEEIFDLRGKVVQTNTTTKTPPDQEVRRNLLLETEEVRKWLKTSEKEMV